VGALLAARESWKSPVASQNPCLQNESTIMNKDENLSNFSQELERYEDKLGDWSRNDSSIVEHVSLQSAEGIQKPQIVHKKRKRRWLESSEMATGMFSEVTLKNIREK